MSDMDDETRAFLRNLFASGREIPRDVVPGSGLTREDLLRRNEMADTWREVTTPGEMTFDVDGMPTGFGPPTTEQVYDAGTVITRSQLEATGLTEADVPNLIVTDDYRPKEKDQ